MNEPTIDYKDVHQGSDIILLTGEQAVARFPILIGERGERCSPTPLIDGWFEGTTRDAQGVEWYISTVFQIRSRPECRVQLDPRRRRITIIHTRG